MRGSRSIISTFVALFFLVVMACINPPARGSEVGNTHVFGVTQLTANVWNAQSEGQSDSNLLQPVIQNLCEPCCPDWSHYGIVDFMFLQRDNVTSGAVITENIEQQVQFYHSVDAASDCSGCPTVLWRAWSRLGGAGKLATPCTACSVPLIAPRLQTHWSYQVILRQHTRCMADEVQPMPRV